MSKPVIGVTLDYEEKGEYSPMPFYALRENYCSSIGKFGGVPVTLPHEPQYAPQYLEMIDGLIVTGGAFDVNPAMYGATEVHQTVSLKERRTAFETAMIRGAIERKMPIIGICGGEQLMNVLLGGTLIQHIPDTIPNALEHEQKNPRTEPGHDVRVVEGTLLHKLAGRLIFPVNTSHHQAVATPGKGVVVNAHAPDGVIEGIEYTDHPFCLGVEWHPEYLISDVDAAIFKAFIAAC